MCEETIVFQPETNAPHLTVINGKDVHTFMLEGEQTFGRISRSSRPDLAVDSGVVSRRHGVFTTNAAGCRYTDTGSTNGTLCCGAMLTEGESRFLSDGDVLRIHGKQDIDAEMDVVLIYSTAQAEKRVWRSLSLTEAAEVVIGRNEQFHLHEKNVSRRHASVFRTKKGWALLDHGSLNGVYLNAFRLEEPVYLKKNDVIRIADYYFVFLGDELLCNVDADRQAAADEQPAALSAADAQTERLPAADEQAADLSAADAQSERLSAADEDEQAADLNAADAQSERLSAADEQPARRKKSPVQPIDGGKVFEDAQGLSVWIEERNVWQRAKKKTLLRDIRLYIPPGSLVLILGGSGAGKTTFMNAVMGYEQAEGEILYKGTDIYREYERMKYEIGYVPQEDLLRKNDSVYDTLLNAARMRLPVMKTEEYNKHVEETLHLLGLERLRDVLVVKLSGGQRKRLSIAVEYVGNPALFFLDEPDSGLDGTMARQLWENLRTIADQGRIVMVISHSPDRAFQLFDKIIVLAKNKEEEGRLVYYGTPAEACAFFDVDNLEKIMQRINYPEEGGEGLADEYIRRFEEGVH